MRVAQSQDFTSGRGALDYVGATSKGEAVAIAVAGAWLGGRVVICQNFGLGDRVNPASQGIRTSRSMR